MSDVFLIKDFPGKNYYESGEQFSGLADALEFATAEEAETRRKALPFRELYKVRRSESLVWTLWSRQGKTNNYCKTCRYTLGSGLGVALDLHPGDCDFCEGAT